MVLTFRSFSLRLIHPFSISVNTRTETPVVFIEIISERLIGYGEASLPPYLSESQNSVIEFLTKVNLSKFTLDDPISQVLDYIEQISPENYAAKSAIDMAVHDLWGKKRGKALYELVGSNPQSMPLTSCTLGMATEALMDQKIKEADKFKILKIKLGGEKDREMVEWIRRRSDKPLYIDANQGWKSPGQALDMIEWLSNKNVVFIEQPLPKGMIEEQAWLLSRSPLPLIADEACQTSQDIAGLVGLYSGINIKLMKCGGIREAGKMIAEGRSRDMKIMIGCMNESSCAVLAAAALAPKCDYVDLDGPFLIENNPFQDPIIQDGKIVLKDIPGIGLVQKH